MWLELKLLDCATSVQDWQTAGLPLKLSYIFSLQARQACVAVDIKVHSFLTFTISVVCCQFHVQAALPQGKSSGAYRIEG